MISVHYPICANVRSQSSPFFVCSITPTLLYVKSIRSQAEFDGYYAGTLLQHSEVEVSPNHLPYLSDDSVESDRVRRKRDVVDWSSRLSGDGMVGDALNATVKSGRSSGKSSRKGRLSASSSGIAGM